MLANVLVHAKASDLGHSQKVGELLVALDVLTILRILKLLHNGNRCQHIHSPWCTPIAYEQPEDETWWTHQRTRTSQETDEEACSDRSLGIADATQFIRFTILLPFSSSLGALVFFSLVALPLGSLVLFYSMTIPRTTYLSRSDGDLNLLVGGSEMGGEQTVKSWRTLPGAMSA